MENLNVKNNNMITLCCVYAWADTHTHTHTQCQRGMGIW